MIVFGRTRVEACKSLGWTEIPDSKIEYCADLTPDAMQEWNRYRIAALGKYWADNGLKLVSTLSWAQPSSYRFCFKGIPKHSTVATSTVGVARDKELKKVWNDGMREAMRRLEPSRVLLYGKNIGFDFGGCKVVEYKAGGFHGR